MFVGHENRIRDRFGHRREPDENPRDYYYNALSEMRINRNSKDGGKIWRGKSEERDRLHSIEHQKHRSSRIQIDDFGYHRHGHPYLKYPEHYHYRSRSPPPPWPVHHRREYSNERRYERRKDADEVTTTHSFRHRPRRSCEIGPAYSGAKHTNYLKTKSNPISKAKPNLKHKWGSDASGGSRNRLHRNRVQIIHKKRSPSKIKESPKVTPKKKSLSRVSSGDLKSSPSTEHLEKQKKYLVDRLAEYEKVRKSSPARISNLKPKSPQEEAAVEKEAAKPRKDSLCNSPIHSSPSSSSLQSFDEREEGIHFNINFPNGSDDDDEAEGIDKTMLMNFEPLENPEFVRTISSLEFKPLFVRGEFKRTKEDGLKEDEKIMIKEFRKNGLKKDSGENKKFQIFQTVVVNTPDTSQMQEPSMAEVSRYEPSAINSPSKLLQRQINRNTVGDGFDLRQRIHERLQNKQTKQVHNQTSREDLGIPFISNYRKTREVYDKDFVEPKPPIRRVVSNDRSMGLVRTFSNGLLTQPKRSVVITRPRPITNSRFLQ